MGDVEGTSNNGQEAEATQATNIDGMISTVPPTRFWFLSLGVCLGLFMSLLDSSIVATSLYTIGVDFEAQETVNWVALAYTLAYLSCAVTFARVSDVIGRRNAFVAGYVIFIAFSLGCGFAQDISQLIAMRVLQGIGGSGLYSLTMVILPEACPVKYRQFLGGLIGMVLAGSGVLGPVLGGVLTQYASWRWVFWINGPIGVISLAIFFFSWPKEGQLPIPPRRHWQNFDYLGSFFVIVAAVLVVFAFQEVAREGSWRSAIFIGPLISGLVSWGALVGWEAWAGRRFTDRISLAFPISLFRNRFYAAAATSTLFMGYPFLLIIFSFPTRAQVVSGKSAVIAGVMLLPMLASSSVATIISGKINSDKDRYFVTIFAGACFMTIGCGLLSTVRDSSDDSKALGFLVFTGLGFGMSTSASTMAGSLEASASDRAPAQGILSQLRILGGSLGIATSTWFLQSQVNDHLVGLLSPHELATLGGGGLGLSQEQRTAVQYVYSEAFKHGMVSATIVAGVGILVTFLAFPHGQRRAYREKGDSS